MTRLYIIAHEMPFMTAGKHVVVEDYNYETQEGVMGLRRILETSNSLSICFQDLDLDLVKGTIVEVDESGNIWVTDEVANESLKVWL